MHQGVWPGADMQAEAAPHSPLTWAGPEQRRSPPPYTIESYPYDVYYTPTPCVYRLHLHKYGLLLNV